MWSEISSRRAIALFVSPLADRGKHLELARREERALAQDIGLPEFAADEGRRLSLAEVYQSLR